MSEELTEKQKRVRDTFTGDKDWTVYVDGKKVIERGKKLS